MAVRDRSRHFRMGVEAIEMVKNFIFWELRPKSVLRNNNGGYGNDRWC